MIINGSALLEAAPIVDMVNEKRSFKGTSYGLAEVGYDIRIKQDIEFLPNYNRTLGYDQIRINHIDGPVQQKYGRFIIASAIEEFEMPRNLMGVVHDKSTWAREGLSVFNTVIEPGWRGWLTLELVYHGQGHLHIPAGSGIAQVIFHQIIEPAEYSGKYQDQADHPVKPIRT